ncbi:MAG: MFS transporter [Alphaproteobacteria bacterium]|nr:MFS transporter [Alphaproteobacteria bacterium]
MKRTYSILSALKLYLQPRLLVIGLLGVVSGLPLALTAGTLGIWLMEAGVDKTTIGLFASVATPYVLKFLWAPLVDQLRIPFLHRFGRRRSWLMVVQAVLVVCIIGLGFSHPEAAAGATALWALLLATASATQDIVIDAYRVEYLKPEDQGAGAAMVVFGYRIGLLLSGAGALYLAEYYSWQVAYVCMAALLPLGALAVLWAGEPAAKRPHKAAKMRFGAWLHHAVVEPFQEFLQRGGAFLILAFILFYKFGDALAGVMTGPFLIDIGFSKSDIATVVKTYGLAATLLGAFMGGILVARMPIMSALLICGILQMGSNLMFALQAVVGADIWLLMATITIENFSGGMGTAAFVAYISRLCNVQYTATQYALLSALASVGRVWLSTSGGWLAETLDWPLFFAASTLAAVPGLLLIYWLRKSMVQGR